MSNHMKDGALLQSLALQLEGRASTNTTRKKNKKEKAHEHELASFRFSYWLGVAMLLQNRPCPPVVVGAFARLLNNCVTGSDFLEFIDCCSSVREILVSHGRWDRELFKAHSSRWLRGLLAAVEHAVNTSLCVHPSSTFRTVTTFLGWLKRLPVAIRPEEISIEKYLECESRLDSIDFESNVYVPQLRKIWFEWFGNFRITDPFLPRHGSGATADSGRVLATKWKSLQIDTVADVCLRFPNLQKVMNIPLGHPSRVSKVVFVPKQAGKDRTICMEPAWLQYLQQGLARQLVAYSHHDHPLSSMINVFDQNNNRTLCARAYEQGYATIDLSDASDSVSFDLMMRLTKGMPLCRYYYATRSHTANIRGMEHPLSKFAPMGSALCFINECFVFASVVELAYRLRYGKASRGHHSGVSVYGDDIVCPQELFESVTEILTSLGFIINAKKSFSSGAYFESCGVEYLYGASIETIKHPRSHLLQEEMWVSPDLVGTVTDLANTLLTSGYFLARRILLKKFSTYSVRVGNRKYRFMDLVTFGSTGLVPMMQSYTTTRWDQQLQRRVRKQFQCKIKPVPDTMDYHHFQWSMVPRTRAERLKTKCFVTITPDPKWSYKATLFLLRSHHWDLLQEGEVCEVGSCRTGVKRAKVHRKWVPC